MEVLVGVDEAGRGPLAGPVAVAAVAVPLGLDIAALIPEVGDSKVLSEVARERVVQRARALGIRAKVAYTSAAAIDRRGIEHAVSSALSRAVAAVAEPYGSFVLLDGRLRAPEAYAQATYVRGDARIPLVGLASCFAKVARDARMRALAKKHPRYGFEAHKGYGTAAHRAAIRRYGLSNEHRATFCRRLAKE